MIADWKLELMAKMVFEEVWKITLIAYQKQLK